MNISASDYRGLVVIVPTRNRADLAIRSIRSVLDARVPDVPVLLSDNSTDPTESEKLRAYCTGQAGDSVRYVSPPTPLGMGAHWNWAFQQALNLYPANHFTVLTDRFVFRSEGLADLCAVVSSFPQDAIVFNFDSVWDHRSPCSVEYGRHSGAIYRCPTDAILAQNARLTGIRLVPVPLSGVTTRVILGEVQAAYGNYCVSIAPDFALGFRTLALRDSIVCLDKAVSINWARTRSNGFSYTRGVLSPDARSFARDLGGRLVYANTPFPAITVVCNAILHEYLEVKKVACDRLPSFDVSAYHEALNTEIEYIENEEMKVTFRQMIRHLDLCPKPTPDLPSWAEGQSTRRPKSFAQRVKGLVLNETMRPIWQFLQRTFSVPMPYRLSHEFPDGERALEYLLRTPRRTQDVAPLPAGAKVIRVEGLTPRSLNRVLAVQNGS